MSNRNTIRLLRKYLSGKATTEEKAMVNKWYSTVPGNQSLTGADLSAAKEEMYQRIRMELEAGARVVPLYKKTFFRVAIAACIIGMIGLGAYQLTFKTRQQPIQWATQPQERRFKNDIPPGRQGAVLTLADEQQIILDNAANGSLAQQANVQIVKNGDEISYVFRPQNNSIDILYNVISTMRGRQFKLVLSDGSKITLDAGSSIRFPTSFTGPERSVEITGQAYFEVAHDTSKPFWVHFKSTKEGGYNKAVRVLGTEFNVNTYEEDEVGRITLLKGSVEVIDRGADKQSAILKPGEQAVAAPHSPLTIHHSPNLEEVMAWKNGYFQCENTSVEAVMRQIARWYDVDIEYEKHINKKISLLNVPRTITLSGILKILEMTGKVKFVIDGKKVIVL